MNEVDAATIEISEALGPDFADLAPPGEAHFFPAAVALAVAYWLLKAVLAGIHDGIQEAAKQGTVDVLGAIG